MEPTYSRIVSACPNATLNHKTGKAVDEKRVYDVFRASCRDEGADENWEHKARYSKIALSPEMMARRLMFGQSLQKRFRSSNWLYKHIVWTDICNSILPRSERKASEQARSRKGKKGWLSPGCEMHSSNLKGAKESEKQKSWGTVRVWWAPVLMRGTLHVEVFNSDFPGECEEGANVLVAKVRAAVNLRSQVGMSQPDTLWTDRGKGFYHPGSGGITAAYRKALSEHNFKAVFGNDASMQPGNLQELMLHETAVSWIRLRLGRSIPPRAWEETREAYASRLKSITADINANLDVILEMSACCVCQHLPGGGRATPECHMS